MFEREMLLDILFYLFKEDIYIYTDVYFLNIWKIKEN